MNTLKNNRGFGLSVLLLALMCVGLLFMTYVRRNQEDKLAKEDDEVVKASGIEIPQEMTRPNAIVKGVENRMEQLSKKMGEREAKLEAE